MLFRKLRALFARRPRKITAEPSNVFGLREERDIFFFNDGAMLRSIDPLLAWDRFRQTDIVEQDFIACDEGDPQAVERVLAMVRSMFGVAEYDPGTGTGLTRHEMAELSTRYFNYIAELKKKRASLPITWRRSEPTPSDTPTTPPCAASTSTPSESNAVEPITPSKPSLPQ